MNNAMVTDSGSTRNPSCTSRLPTGSQSNSTCWNRRSCSGSLNRPMKTATDATKAPPHMIVANQPASGSPSLRPPTTSTRKPNNGSAGISQTSSTTSAFQCRDVVGGGAGAASHERDDDAEADHDLGRGHDEHEEHDRLSADVVEVLGEGDEREVHGVEHQLDAHEHHQGVAPHHQANRTDGEEERAQHQIPGRRRLHRGQCRHPCTSAASSEEVSALDARRASTTAATTA